MAAFDRASPSPSMSVGVGGAISEDTLFVAVTRDFTDTKSVLLWALQNRLASGICLIHIHQPDKRIPTPLGRIPINLANKTQVQAHRVTEREELSRKLDKHLQFCRQHGVIAAKIYVEMDSIEDGIVKLITDQKIRKLVMGAAADKRHIKGMIKIISEKAKYVNQQSPGYCHIWFVCKKLLIHTREATEKSARFEGIERFRSVSSYEFSELNRNLSSSTYCSSLSEPSAPDLSSSQHIQQDYDLYPSSLKTREDGNPSLDELVKVKNSEELQVALDRMSLSERRIEKSDLMVEQLERRLNSARETVEKYKKERDEMEVERDIAVKEVDEARNQLKEGHSTSSVLFPMITSELPFQDILIATNKFDQSLKVRDDAYGITYKGSFNLQLAVKIPHPTTLSTPREFQQEVEMMNKLKHPNIVNLIGTSPESRALIYEYCANGSLEDQVNSNSKTPPLKWQTRIRIATSLCNVLIFLHSHKPDPIIHGDIRAGNIHLDSQFNCKLDGFRTSIAILNGTFSVEKRGIGYANIDPEYFQTQEFTTKSDVYSFGIVLMRLLTGKPAIKLVKEVQKAVEFDGLSGLVDRSAEWPRQQAMFLADLALRCCETTHRRPDLDPAVWKVMEYIEGLSH